MAAFHLPDLKLESHPTRRALVHAFWVVSGVIVLLFIFVAALGAIDPADAVAVTVVVLLLAVLWLAHEWSQLWRAERRE